MKTYNLILLILLLNGLVFAQESPKDFTFKKEDFKTAVRRTEQDEKKKFSDVKLGKDFLPLGIISQPENVWSNNYLDNVDRYALKFQRDQPWQGGVADHHVYHGQFYTPGQILGVCWWEAWVAPTHGAQYFIAMNYGGGHPILIGFSGATSGKLGISGNMKEGENFNSFGSIDFVDPDTWHHVAVGYDGQNAFVYLDGILTDRRPVTRRVVGTAPNENKFWVGSSRDHNGFNGKILRIRGFEGATPFAGNLFPMAFTPQLFFTSTVDVGPTSVLAASFATDYSRVSDILYDYSNGYNGHRHDGYRAMFENQQVPEERLPQWVLANFAKPTFQGTPEPIPAGAILFDDFSQANETYAWSSSEPSQSPRIRRARTGQPWLGDLAGNAEVGVIEGAACPLSNDVRNGSPAQAEVGSANHQVSVTQRGAYGAQVYVRYADPSNFLLVSAVGRTATITKYVGGNMIPVAQPPEINDPNWTNMTVTAEGGSIRIQMSGLDYSFAENNLSGTKIGFLLTALQRVDRILVTATTPGCAYSIAPNSTNISANGGNGSFSVTSPSGCPWTAMSNSSWISLTSGNSGTGFGTVSFSVAPNTGSGTRTGTITVQGQTFTVNQAGISSVRPSFDFDGDRKADISVFRPSTNVWHIINSANGSYNAPQFGANGDLIVPADYDGDGKCDVAVFRNGNWYLQRSTLGFMAVQFGSPNDIPIPADYDGDGKADTAVFRPTNGIWYLNGSQIGFRSVPFGQTGDKPIPADYDGDGKADIAVFRPEQGTWYLQRSSFGFTSVQFGNTADKLVPADYDGDGKADIGVFRLSNGVWYLNRSQAGFSAIAFGLGTDSPVPADYDGDGRTDVAVFRNGNWYLQRSQAGFISLNFGVPTDQPVPGAFVP